MANQTRITESVYKWSATTSTRPLVLVTELMTILVDSGGEGEAGWSLWLVTRRLTLHHLRRSRALLLLSWLWKLLAMQSKIPQDGTYSYLQALQSIQRVSSSNKWKPGDIDSATPKGSKFGML
eukprot:5284535-Amphidinium_carterae.1